jgi:hypothetical protein
MDKILNSHDWLPWLQEIWKALMGKIVLNGFCFIWVKFHGQIFIKIGISQLFIIIIMILKGPISQNNIFWTIKSLICAPIP